MNYNERLKLKFLYTPDGKMVIFQDGVIYSKEELAIANKKPEEIDGLLHEAKKIFKGEIVEDKKSQG